MENETKYTPGPWKVFDQNHVIEVQRGDCTEPIIHWTGFDAAPGTLATHRANARLIAAAPDLLVALKRAALVLAGDTMSKAGLIAALEAARSAIAKAEEP